MCEEAQTGWKIEKKYSPLVLIGNWSEERNKFTKGNYDHKSTYRLDYKKLPGHKPDTVIRRRSQLKNEGYGSMIMSHGLNKRGSDYISWYDEHYNGRKREPWDELPKLRNWDSHTLGWIPERSDYPMRGAPTNFGLYEKIMEKARNEPLNKKTDYNTTYTSSYTKYPQNAFKVSRFAQHREYPNEVTLPKLEPAPSQPLPENVLTTVAC